MSQIESIKVIKTLDNPLRFLYWEYSQVLFFALVFLISLLTLQSFIPTLIVSALCMLMYKKIKKRIFKNFKRFSYWTFFYQNTKAFPHSYKRKFIRI
jgi:type IV conjugative transfer system protein TraL